MKVTIRFTPNEVAFIDRIADTLHSSRSYAARALIGSWAVVSQTPLGTMLSPDVQKAILNNPGAALRGHKPLIEQIRPMDEIMAGTGDGRTRTAQKAGKTRGK